MKDVVLAVIAIAAPIIAAASGWRFSKQTRTKMNLDNSRTAVGIQIDEVTRNKLVMEAANVNQEREQKREEWWGGQIQMLREEIEAERTLSNLRFRRLNQLERWAMEHVSWDRKAWMQIRETDPDFDAPPELPADLPPMAS